MYRIPRITKKRTNFSTFLVKIENKYEPSKCEIGIFYRGNESQPYSHWMSIPHEFTHIKCSRVIIYFGIWTVRKWVDFDVNAKQNPIPYRIYSPSFCLFVSWHVGANVTTQSYTILAHNMRISVTVLVVCRLKHMLLLGFFLFSVWFEARFLFVFSYCYWRHFSR